MRIEWLTLGPAATNVWLVANENTGQVIIADPADGADRVIDRITACGWNVCGILLTHGHFDHIMAVEALRKHYGVQVYASAAERDLLMDPRMNLSGPWMGHPITVKPDVYLLDGETFPLAGMEIQMISTPGHTAGSCCYYISAERVLLSGDTLFSDSYGRTDLPTGSGAAIFRSIREKLMVLPPETKVYPGHGDITTIEMERANFL